MFNGNITISVKRFEELIQTEAKYNYLYSLVYNHFKDVLEGVFDYLDDIDFYKFKELYEKKQEN